MKIDAEFKSLIPPLSQEEYAQLEANILADGCRDALVPWEGTLIDGHNRYEICSKHGVDYRTEEMAFEDRNDVLLWIIRNQLGRRNLASITRAELALKLEPLVRDTAKRQQGERNDIPQNSAECFQPIETRTVVAKMAGMSHDTLTKAKVILDQAPEPVKEKLRAGETTIHAEYKKIKEAERLAKRELETAPELTCTVSDLQALIKRDVRFKTIYADPPWLYDNQSTRGATSDHYNGMSVEHIAALPIADLAADDAHLHLWTTSAFLFDAKKIMEDWGFEYKSYFVWVKPQMGMGNYWRMSSEIMLFGKRGKEPFGAHDEQNWLVAPRGEHSAKPERIRELIEKVSPGPRLELFGRQMTKGWVVWGNEIRRTRFETDVQHITEDEEKAA